MPSPVAGVLDTKGNVAQAVSYMNSQSGSTHSSSRQEAIERESAKEQFLLPHAGNSRQKANAWRKWGEEQREKGGWATFQRFLDNQAKEFGISADASIS